MTIAQRPLFNMDLGETGDRFQVVWVDVKAETAHEDALKNGGARFQRLEGCHFAGGAFWFDDTSGGEERVGQVFRLIPSGDPSGGGTDTLELFLEGDSKDQMDAPDNLLVTPWGTSSWPRTEEAATASSESRRRGELRVRLQPPQRH